MRKPIAVYCLVILTLVLLIAMSCGSSDDEALVACVGVETAS